MSTTFVTAGPTTDEREQIHNHPRGRGFGILSRMARTDDEVVRGRHVREDATYDEPAHVVVFERRLPDPRHRRDDEAGQVRLG